MIEQIEGLLGARIVVDEKVLEECLECAATSMKKLSIETSPTISSGPATMRSGSAS
ncbi:MAG: hypothetical protein ACM31L_16410 [Actinomycetota bacterium]